MLKLNRFYKNIGIYFLSNFSTKILQLLFIPLYSIFIKPDDFGYYSLILSMLSLSIPILYQSIWEGVLRYSIERENQEYKVISTAALYCIGITLIYGLCFLIINLYFDIDYSPYILIMGISQMLITFYLFSARALKENKVYALSTVVQSIVITSLSIYLIAYLRLGILALFITYIAGNIIGILILEWKLKVLCRISRANFQFSLLAPIIKYSLPLSFNAASWWLITSFNNFVITYRISIYENGIYSMANKFGSILTLVTSVVSLAWIEESFRIHGSKNSDKYFNKVLDVLIRLVFGTVAILIPITNIFYQFSVSDLYSSGVTLIPIIYLSAAFSSLAAHLASGFLARKESELVLKTTIIGGIVSAVGGLIMVKYFGVMGVVTTSLIGFILMFVIRIPILKKRMDLKVNASSLFISTSICLLVSVISNYFVGSLINQIIILIATFIATLIYNYKVIKLIFSSR